MASRKKANRLNRWQALKGASPSGPLNATDQPQGLLKVSIRHLRAICLARFARKLVEGFHSSACPPGDQDEVLLGNGRGGRPLGRMGA